MFIAFVVIFGWGAIKTEVLRGRIPKSDQLGCGAVWLLFVLFFCFSVFYSFVVDVEDGFRDFTFFILSGIFLAAMVGVLFAHQLQEKTEGKRLSFLFYFVLSAIYYGFFIWAHKAGWI